MPTRRRGRHEGSIYKRKDGRWEAAYRSSDGRRYITGRKNEARESVAARLHDALTRLRSGMPLVQYRDSFGAFLESWLESVRVSRAPKTYESYSDTVRLHIKPIIGSVPLRRVGPADVQRAMTAAKDAGLAPRTVAYVRSMIRRALHLAQGRGLVHQNAAEFVPSPKIPRTEVPIPSAKEWKKFLSAISGADYEALFLTLSIVGPRRGEVLGLRWSDYDERAATLRFTRALQRVRIAKGKGELRIMEVKTPSSRRALKIPKVIAAALKRYRRKQREWRIGAGELWGGADLIFTTRIGTPIDPRNAKRMLDRVLSDAKLPHRTIHEQRHIAASNLLAAGERLEVVSAILGHSSIRVTKDVYGHIVPALMDAAADRMEQIGRR